MYLIASICPPAQSLTAEPFDYIVLALSKIFVCVCNLGAFADNIADAVDTAFDMCIPLVGMLST